MLRKILLFTLVILTCLVNSCTKGTGKTYKIGIDPNFFPLELGGKSPNVLAFSTELLEEVAKLKKVAFLKINRSWDNLIIGLNDNYYDAALSALNPNIINLTKYSFSNSYLDAGPVLIVPITSSVKTLKDLSSKTIALEKGANEISLLSQYPEIEFAFYNSMVEALEDTARGQYDACLIPAIPAYAYIQDLFSKSLKITTPPLTNDALRLITQKDMNPALINLFDQALDDLKSNGKLEKLCNKWKVPYFP